MGILDYLYTDIHICIPLFQPCLCSCADAQNVITTQTNTKFHITLSVHWNGLKFTVSGSHATLEMVE